RKLVCQFGVHPEFRRRGYGRSLLAKLCTRHGRLRLINVDGRSEGMLRFSENVGLEHIVDQYEMRLDL
ncbi:MAG: GNAT family N-acetyltransferase, partial [Saprospiraceae bacterium]|nr:GNAT family N-acetyltransferase [Saprospiraceae bacterium]MCB0683262.1 GNAT family N-acetyltransferase [Saprospiraceae bacterium]